MSKHHTEEIVCPGCQYKGNFEIWDSINTVLNPEMKEKVLNQSIFSYTCPNCGETFQLAYSTLYHQMEDLIMIYLVSESEVEKTQELFCVFDAGKDDRIVELVKLIVTDYLHQNCPDQKFDELFFATDDSENNILVILHDGDITSTVDIDSLYEKAASDFSLKDIRDDDVVINRDWILNRLSEEDE